MTEQQRKALREQYQKDYRKITGYKLQCTEIPENMSLEELHQAAIEVFNMDPMIISRKREHVIARLAVWKIARELGYIQEDIAKASGHNRSTVSTAMTSKTMQHPDAKIMQDKLREYIAKKWAKTEQD